MGKGRSSTERQSFVSGDYEDHEIRFLKSGVSKGYLVMAPLKKLSKAEQQDTIEKLLGKGLVEEHRYVHYVRTHKGTQEREPGIRYFLTGKGRRIAKNRMEKEQAKKAAESKARTLARLEKAFKGYGFSDMSLASRDILTHLLINRHDPNAKPIVPNQDYFKTQLGLTQTMVRAALKELKVRDLVEKREATMSLGGKTIPTHYDLSSAGHRLHFLLDGYAKHKRYKFEKTCNQVIYAAK